MPDDFQDRTEEPTEFRRRDAREKGQVARSTDLVAAGVMLAAAAAILLFASGLAESLGTFLGQHLTRPPRLQIDLSDIPALALGLAQYLARTILPLMLLMFAAAIGFNVVQVGFLFAPEALRPKFSHISPLQGIRRIVSIQALAKLGMSLGKLAVICAVAALFIGSALPWLLAMTDVEWETIVAVHGNDFREQRVAALVLLGIRQNVVVLAFQMAGALVVLGLIDWGFQRWKHSRDLRMTKQELRDELKQMEGDPHIRMRRREVHRKLAEARELKHVETADVVITNPTHLAIALKYDPERMSAPKIVAKGAGEIALRIRQIAAEHGIPIIERKPLAQALYRQIKVGREIPVEMYEVFVEILAHVYRLTGRTPANLS